MIHSILKIFPLCLCLLFTRKNRKVNREDPTSSAWTLFGPIVLDWSLVESFELFGLSHTPLSRRGSGRDVLLLLKIDCYEIQFFELYVFVVAVAPDGATAQRQQQEHRQHWRHYGQGDCNMAASSASAIYVVQVSGYGEISLSRIFAPSRLITT